MVAALPERILVVPLVPVGSRNDGAAHIAIPPRLEGPGLSACEGTSRLSRCPFPDRWDRNSKRGNRAAGGHARRIACRVETDKSQQSQVVRNRERRPARPPLLDCSRTACGHTP